MSTSSTHTFCHYLPTGHTSNNSQCFDKRSALKVFTNKESIQTSDAGMGLMTIAIIFADSRSRRLLYLIWVVYFAGMCLAREPGMPAKQITGTTGTLDSTTQNPKGISSVRSFESSLTVISHQAFSEEHKFCRLKGVCRVGDGTIMLPEWMKAYSAHIAKCGISKVSYNLADFHRGNILVHLRAMDSRLRLTDDYRDFDVIGGEVPRGERNLLASDITPVILLLDLFRRPGAYGNHTQTLCVTKQGSACQSQNASDISLFNPMILVDSRISDTKDFMWPKSLLRLLRNAVDGNLAITDLKDLYGWKVRSEASCFHSLVSTNVVMAEIPAGSLLPSNLFFSMNRLSRTAPGSSRKKVGTCSIKVLVLNRYGKRFIEGSDKLSSAISSYAVQVRKVYPKVLVEPEVVFFENSSFHEQVSVMQESSVVVASHGDGNANFLFLRPNTRVFEVLPFGFTSDLYRNLSRAYGAIYSAVRAQPDEEVFVACVKHFNPKESTERNEFFTMWKAAADSFSEETLRKKANIESDYAVPDDDGDSDNQALRRLKQCASYQRISVDVKHLARVVAKAAAEQCNVQGDVGLAST